MSQTHIWWIRRDIRLHDNQTLEAARQEADHLLPLFIIEPELMEEAAPKRRDFLLHALSDLNHKLQDFESQLVVRQGPALEAFEQLSKELGDMMIFAHEDFSPFSRERDQEVAKTFTLNQYHGVTLRGPEAVLKDDGDPYVVYTPYKNKWYESSLPTPADCLPAPDSLPPLPENITSQDLSDYEPVPDFPGTAEEAQSRLTKFTSEGIHHYHSRRDRLDLDGTSKLSPYLRFGLLSAREAFANAQIAYLQADDDEDRSEIRTWMDELVWREFYNTILYHFPSVMEGPFRDKYQDVPWRDAPDDLEAWQEGTTGFPIVDACMRQLKETGWMHNRGRMIVASFLTKDLLINWQEGEAWFMAKFVDGDPAANNGGWQWSAGTGTDAAPYFRIFNPILQGQKYDPDGAFIAQWVPSLKKLPEKFRHEPWKMTDEEAERYGFRKGQDYPERIVEHQFARERAIEAFKSAV
ncbi:MAG: cryptochrome/photolyase family protein [Brevefilum sp.]